ncbi:MAG: GNAT family N-acetyltransferase [Chloroflexi bacterium]|nr:GNAT family N-acetyltransferase [Chloroflexota bacterium]
MSGPLHVFRAQWPTTPEASATWERLRQAAPTETLFLTPEWLQGWHRHLGTGQPLLFAVADGDETVALAPIERSWVGGFSALRPLGLGVSDYTDLLLPPASDRAQAAVEALADALIERGGAWDVLDLRGLPAESATADLLMAVAERRGMRGAAMPGYARPEIALDGTYDQYLSSRPGRFRYNLRSRLRRLGERGEVCFRRVSDPEDVPSALTILAELHARRWRGQHTATIFSSSSAARRFYAEVCAQYAARDLLDLTLLEVGGRAVGGSLGFVDGDTFYYYIPAWEPELASLAPSSLLLANLVEGAYARGLKRFDFMLGDEPYKARWATGERQTLNLVIGAPTLRGQAAFAALVGAQKARRRARSSPLLQRARRHWLGRAKQLIGR